MFELNNPNFNIIKSKDEKGVRKNKSGDTL